MSRRRRGLSKEERTLWETVARTVAPLRPVEMPAEIESPPPPPETPVIEMKPAPPPPAARARPAVPKPPPLHPIEKRTLTRVARGSTTIDARIDLHGMTQLAAHDRLHRFLRDAQASGARLVLIITGKGRPGSEDGGPGEERGVLRRRVPQWLAEPAMRSIVIGFEEAHRTHGGGGALYVRIRKARAAPGSPWS